MYKKILVVDDSKTLRNFFRLTFRHMKDVQAVMVPNGERALEALDVHQNIEAVLLDWNLPGISGLEVLRHIRMHPNWHSTPVFILSAENEDNVIIDAMNRGADGYIVKPFSPRGLLETLERFQLARNRGRDTFLIPPVTANDDAHRGEDSR